MNVLLVDFGASRVKAVLWSLDQNKKIKSFEVPSPTPIYGKKGEVETDPYEYIEIWYTITNNISLDLVDEIWVCSEMHGIIITDEQGVPITKYISWKDSRGSTKGINQKQFLDETGMKLCSGLPFVTLKHLKKHNQLPNKFRMLTLIDWILLCWADTHRANETLLAGTGFYSIQSHSWLPSLTYMGGIFLPGVVPVNTYIGLMQGKKVYGGVGDLQAAINGSNLQDNTILINLGTGSQIVMPSNYKDSDLINTPTTEKRIGVNGEIFPVITHIPCGRALDVFANFLGHTLFWNWFAVLESKQILKSKIEIIMNVFTSGGFICNIKEKNFTQRTFMEGLALSWLKQYTRLIEDLDPQNVYKRIYVSGGLSRRLPFIKPVLEALSGREVQLVKPITGEETLDGLLKLAQRKNNDR